MFPCYIDERFLYAITPIREAEGNQTIIGTGFFFKSSETLYLVTAKHVLLDLKKFIIEFHTSNPYNLENFTVQDHTLLAPDNTTDVCAVKLDVTGCNGLQFTWFGKEHLMTDDKLLETFTSLTSVAMSGYPTGLYDDHNHLPIYRTGFTASHPGLKYKGLPEGIVNVSNFECDSGSPICHFPQSIEFSKKETAQVAGGLPFCLLGIHHEGYDTHSTLGLTDIEEENPEQMQLAKYVIANLLSSIEIWALISTMRD